MTTVSRREFFNDLGGNAGAIDVNQLSPELAGTLDSAGIDRAALLDIAGDDGVISGLDEMDRLFTLVDGQDRNGNRNSLDVGTAAAPTASGTLFEALRGQSHLLVCSPDVRPAPPAPAQIPPGRMSATALLAEYHDVKKRLADQPSYPGRAADEQRAAALETEMMHRGASGIEARRGLGRIPDGTMWKPVAMQPGQFELRTRMYAPFDTFGGVPGYEFEGDARGPTPRLHVTSRMTQATVIDARDPAHIKLAGDRSYGDASAQYYGGDIVLDDRATPSEHTEIRPDAAGGAHIIQDLRGKNPLLPGAVTPAIDVNNDVHVDRDGDRLRVRGTMSGDRFPNGEVLLTDAKGQTILLGSFETDANGRTGPLTRLPGDGGEYMTSYYVNVVLDGDGNFAGVEDPSTGRTMSVQEWNDRQIARSAGK